MLSSIGIHNSSVKSIANIPNKTYSYEVEITNDDVQAYISDILEANDGGMELTDEFVLTHTEYKSVNEFINYIETYVKMSKQHQNYLNHKKEFLNYLVKKSVFNIDENEIVEYALTIIESYETDAKVLNMSLEDYYNSMLMSEDDFFNKCYSDAEYEIKTYLIVGALSEKYHISITEDDLNIEFKKYGYDEDYLEKNKDTIKYVKYHCLEEKTLRYLLYGTIPN